MTSTEESDLPFILQRKQLPVMLGYALTIHKCQGQTFRGRGGLWLKSPVFAHGHLYVAFSRATGFRKCAVHISEEEDGQQGQENGWWRTNNVVLKVVLGRSSTTTTAEGHDGGRSRTLQGRPTPATPTATTAAPERHGTEPLAAAPGPPDVRQVQEGTHASTPGAGRQEDTKKRRPRKRRRRRGRRRTAWRWHHHWTPRNSGSIRATYSTRTCACRKHSGSPGATARWRQRSSTATSHRWKTSDEDEVTHRTTPADRVEYLATEDLKGAQSLLPGRRTYEEGNDPEEDHDPALPREELPEQEPALGYLGENPPDPAAAQRDASHDVDTRDDMPYREPQGYRPEDVPGDGNCLFHALTTAAGWRETAAQMRQRVVNYAVAHNDVWSGTTCAGRWAVSVRQNLWHFSSIFCPSSQSLAERPLNTASP